MRKARLPGVIAFIAPLRSESGSKTRLLEEARLGSARLSRLFRGPRNSLKRGLRGSQKRHAHVRAGIPTLTAMSLVWGFHPVPLPGDAEAAQTHVQYWISKLDATSENVMREMSNVNNQQGKRSCSNMLSTQIFSRWLTFESDLEWHFKSVFESACMCDAQNISSQPLSRYLALMEQRRNGEHVCFAAPMKLPQIEWKHCAILQKLQICGRRAPVRL